MHHLNVRPVIKLKMTEGVVAVEILSLLVLIILWFSTFLSYPTLPNSIPIHFTAFGEPDKYAEKSKIFFLPSLATVLYIGITALSFFPHSLNYPMDINYDNAEIQYTAATKMLRRIKLIILFFFVGLLTLLINESETSAIKYYGAWFLPLSVLVIFIPFFMYIMRSLKEK